MLKSVVVALPDVVRIRAASASTDHGLRCDVYSLCRFGLYSWLLLWAAMTCENIKISWNYEKKMKYGLPSKSKPTWSYLRQKTIFKRTVLCFIFYNTTYPYLKKSLQELSYFAAVYDVWAKIWGKNNAFAAKKNSAVSKRVGNLQIW